MGIIKLVHMGDITQPFIKPYCRSWEQFCSEIVRNLISNKFDTPIQWKRNSQWIWFHYCSSVLNKQNILLVR